MTTELERLQTLFRSIFDLTRDDLSFGIHRIYTAKREELTKFISERIPDLCNNALATYQHEVANYVQGELEQLALRVLGTLGPDALDTEGNLVHYADTALGREYQQVRSRAAQARVGTEIASVVYSDLFNFFGRYYVDGDFIPTRRYGINESYAVPYDGNEVLLHWANKEQYFVKTAENVSHYGFLVGDGRSKIEVRFGLAQVEVTQGSQAAAPRYFFLAAEEPIRWRAAEQRLEISFDYRSAADAEKTHIDNHQGRPQDAVNEKSYATIIGALEPELKSLLARAETGTTRSVLLHHLTTYARRSTSDFFVHRDLRSFFTRELIFFLKELMPGDEDDDAVVRTQLARRRAIRAVAAPLIDLLAQVENLLRQLFEKRKFVVATDYLITVNRLPRRLWGAVLGNPAQLGEWRVLYRWHKGVAAMPQHPDERFLENNGSLVADTRHFSPEFKWQFLASLENVDESIQGTLMQADNFHASTLLSAKYRGAVQCIYIDPPFNTESDQFLYKDRFQDSSWLSLIDNGSGQ